MNHLDKDNREPAGRRQGDRRVATNDSYTGSERRQGDRRVGHRRIEPGG